MKNLANRFDTDGVYDPIEFFVDEPNYVIEALAGIAGLIAFVSFIFVVMAL